MRISDWSSDVCSSDLVVGDQLHGVLGVVLPLPLDGDPEGVADLGDALGAPALLDCQQRRREGDLPVDGALGVDMDEAVHDHAGEVALRSEPEAAPSALGNASWRDRECQYA